MENNMGVNGMNGMDFGKFCGGWIYNEKYGNINFDTQRRRDDYEYWNL